jgi:hypothetical protein
MELWMTALTDRPGFAAAFEAGKQLIEPAFNARFRAGGYGKGLIELQYRAILHPPNQRIAGESKKYAKTSHTAEISSRVEVPVNGSNAEMVARLATSLSRTLQRLKALNIDNFDVERFAEDYANFAVAQDWITVTNGAAFMTEDLSQGLRSAGPPATSVNFGAQAQVTQPLAMDPDSPMGIAVQQ